MSSMNKKGLAEVITIVMIILISISSVVIFFAAITSTATQLSPALSCNEHKISQTVKMESVCFTPGEFGEINLMLKRNFNTNLNNIKFSASEGNIKEEWVCGQSCGECSPPLEGETKTYKLQLNKIAPEYLTISVDNCILEKTKIEIC